VVLDRYRGPLLDAAWQLGDRVDNIRNRSFLAFLSNSSGRERDARLSTLFRFAYYLGWREYVRTQVQLLPFENEEDTRLAAAFLNDITRMLASGALDGQWAMLWSDEQRGIGELMTEQPPGASAIVRGHASFTATTTRSSLSGWSASPTTCSRQTGSATATVCNCCSGRCTGLCGNWTRRVPTVAAGLNGAQRRSARCHHR
jgi:hypothetical protein